MPKKKLLAGAGIAATAALVFLLGSLGLVPAFAQAPHSANVTQGQAVVQEEAGSITADQAQHEGVSEADEAAALQSKAAISAADAESAALAADPGTTVVKTELDSENGVLAYSVELSSGKDVKVDAGTGKVLHIEQAGGHDSVQKEHHGQPDDAAEAAGAESEPGQESAED